MINRKKIKIAFVVVACVFSTGMFIFLKKPSENIQKNTQQESVISKSSITINSKNTPPLVHSEIKPKPHVSKTEQNNIILLNSENFEARSAECFQGAMCEVEGNPWDQYLAIKQEGKRSVTDLYIAFLRKKLKDPSLKDQYKDFLKQMITDFYPADQVDFQMAAYYNYLGELESSLNSYIELERKAKKDPRLFTAPKLNIANTYYDLKRFKEALVYYKMSLNDLKSTETNDSIESINFINERIDIIQEKLRIR